MKRLRQLRNSVYIIFIFLVSVISVAAAMSYADTHDLVIIKRVYPKIDGKIIPKSYILGHQKQHMIGGTRR